MIIDKWHNGPDSVILFSYSPAKVYQIYVQSLILTHGLT